MGGAEDEELFLADIEEDSQLFLADVQEENISQASVDMPVNENSDFQTEEKNSEKDFSELEQVFAILKIAEKPANVDFKEYFKSNPDIFKVAGTDYYKSPSAKQYEAFEKKCIRLTEAANKKWRSIENQTKIEDLDNALGTLRRIFKYPEEIEAFSKEIKRNLTIQLRTFLHQKTKDNILEVSEIQELIEIAVSIRLVPDTKAGKKSILDWIKKLTEHKGIKIESFKETFVRLVSQKEKIERLDSESVKNALFKEYKALSDISAQVLPGRHNQTDEELREDMLRLLKDNNLLVPNTDFFITDFLEPEIARKGEFYFNAPLYADYYYYLKGTAVNKYELSEEQWRQIAMSRNIRNENEFTVAFIMGYKKESSVQGIAKLLEENAETAASRILAGDLETYFAHIGHKDISAEIAKLKDAYKTNSNELVIGVVNLLKETLGESVDMPDDEPETETIDSLIEEKAALQELVSFVVKNKTDESLISRIASNSDLQERIQVLLFSHKMKTTYRKFLLNILHELLQENDISQYAFAFIKIALAAQETLLSQNDYLTFLFVYAPIVQNALSADVLKSEDELSGYAESKAKTEELYKNDLDSIQKSVSKNKPKFKLFHKGAS